VVTEGGAAVVLEGFPEEIGDGGVAAGTGHEPATRRRRACSYS
jgi:hypothetical protein